MLPMSESYAWPTHTTFKALNMPSIDIICCVFMSCMGSRTAMHPYLFVISGTV